MLVLTMIVPGLHLVGSTAVLGGRATRRTADLAGRLARSVTLAVDPTGGQGRARRNARSSTATDAARARDRRTAESAVTAAGARRQPWVRAI